MALVVALRDRNDLRDFINIAVKRCGVEMLFLDELQVMFGDRNRRKGIFIYFFLPLQYISGFSAVLMEALAAHPTVRFVVTGSHDLLSACFEPTYLGDRYDCFTLFPFSFAEFYTSWCVPFTQLLLLTHPCQEGKTSETDYWTSRDRTEEGNQRESKG